MCLVLITYASSKSLHHFWSRFRLVTPQTLCLPLLLSFATLTMGRQIAKAQGAWVATTCSGKNTAFVSETLGADLAIDYTKEK